jgi:hypothetical protein
MAASGSVDRSASVLSPTSFPYTQSYCQGGVAFSRGSGVYQQFESRLYTSLNIASTFGCPLMSGRCTRTRLGIRF